jgi:hypothetical protein
MNFRGANSEKTAYSYVNMLRTECSTKLHIAMLICCELNALHTQNSPSAQLNPANSPMAFTLPSSHRNASAFLHF